MYRYLGDRNTEQELKNVYCTAVRNAREKCIRGKNGNMLIQLSNGKKVVVVARLLRKIKAEQ